MRVRRATPEDAAAIADVQLRTWLDAYAGYVARDKMLAKAEGREEVWRGRLEDGVEVFVSVEDDRIVGIASAAGGELRMLYVAPEAQGRGHGRALVDRCVAQLREEGAAEVGLWVFEANAGARGFYERMGFVLEPGPPHADAWAPEVRYRRAL